MRAFWNELARDDPYYFVDNRRPYRSTERATFWADGERDLDRLLGVLGVRVEPSDVVLDIGCGVGRLTRALAAHAARVYAIDVSDVMLACARRLHRSLANVEWVVGDGVSLQPLEDGSVDACVSHVVFQHIPDPAITLGYVTEMGRVLRSGGWAAFQVSGDQRVHSVPTEPVARLRRATSRPGRRPAGEDDPAWLGSAVELSDVRAAGTRGGLEIDRVVGEGTQFCLILARKPAITL
jgi:SAM-dependent methyltransferase